MVGGKVGGKLAGSRVGTMRHFAPRWILTRGKEQKVEALMTMRFSWGGSTTKFELFMVPY